MQAGCRVYVASRKIPDQSISELNSLGQAAGGQAFPISADLSTLEGVDNVVQTIKEKEGKLHVLVNNGKSGSAEIVAKLDEGLIVDLRKRSWGKLGRLAARIPRRGLLKGAHPKPAACFYPHSEVGPAPACFAPWGRA